MNRNDVPNWVMLIVLPVWLAGLGFYFYFGVERNSVRTLPAGTVVHGQFPAAFKEEDREILREIHRSTQELQVEIKALKAANTELHNIAVEERKVRILAEEKLKSRNIADAIAVSVFAILLLLVAKLGSASHAIWFTMISAVSTALLKLV